MVWTKTSKAIGASGFCCLFLARILCLAQLDENQQAEFFEKSVRPLLVARCLECHSKETETNGGLALDSKAGWMVGGDSGPAINPADWTSSLLWRAVEYRNPKLQMPPDSKLSDQEREVIKSWLSNGAFDPRVGAPLTPTKKSTALPVNEAQSHWAYRQTQESLVPPQEIPTGNSIDAFLAKAQVAIGIEPSERASPSILGQRLLVDLHGLRSYRCDDLAGETKRCAEVPYDAQVDALLASPRFGERFARHWMDAVRFAESITLRGFVLPDAWRYRNYVIDSFNADRPISEFIREQVAGDLMRSETLHDRQRRLIATTALALGDTNLEEQDKKQLEMDYVDEQLDMIGKVFLAQTIGCARCHDHKFDPIPTSDYYALAGILKSSVAMDHSNVSKWVSLPLPQDIQTESRYAALSSKRTQVKKRLDGLKKSIQDTAPSSSIVRVEDLQGVVIDDAQAKKVGEWVESMSVKPYVGRGYLHDKNASKGAKSMTFEPADLKPGSYRVRFSYTPDANRAKAVKVRIFSADGEDLVSVNQSEKPADDGLWQTLGTYRFEQGGQAFVIVSNEGSQGHVVADAVQFLPEALAPNLADKASKQEPQAAPTKGSEAAIEALRKEAASLESELKAMQAELDSRPTVLSLRAAETPSNIAIHIRGSVHQQGALVPRGFLSCIASQTPSPTIEPSSNGRLELADWLVSSRNPLTARVYVNRVWSWLMGEGIVRTIDNFGTTGEQPSNLELLDWLTHEFIRRDWSTKWLVREIVLSDAYQRSSRCSKAALEIDPDNRHFARGNSRRLDAETFRDSLLNISGELDLSAHIESTIPAKVKEDYAFKHSSKYRTVYGPWFRNSLPDLYTELDGANPSFPISKRNRSTIAPQALAMLNSEWIADRVSVFGDWLAAKPEWSDEKKIECCFVSTLSRLPSSRELNWAKSVVAQHRTAQSLEGSLWGTLAHELIASIDFRYVE